MFNKNCDKTNIIKKIIIVNDCDYVNTYSLIYNNDYQIITECNFPKLYPNEENNEEISYLIDIIDDNLNDIFNDTINYNNDNNEKKTLDLELYKNEIINLLSKMSKEEKKESYKQLISLIGIGENEEIKGDGFTIRAMPTNSSFYRNGTHIIFNECEKILREYYNISNSSILTILQIETDYEDLNVLINAKNQIFKFIIK